MESERHLKSITKGAGIVFIGLVISKLFGYLYRIIVARLGAEEYGLLSVGIAFFGILTTISVLGLNKGILRYVSYYKGKSDYPRIREILISAIKITLPLSIVFSLSLFIFSNKISITFFNNQNLAIVLKILALAIPFAVLSEIFINAIRAFQKVRYEVYSKNITENLIRVILTLVFLLLGLKLFGITLAYSISIFTTAVLSFYFLEKKIYPFFKTDYKESATGIKRELLLYSWPLSLSTFTFLIMLWIDTLMLAYLTKNPSLVGIYNAVLPTAQLLYVLPYALTYLFLPILTELYSQGNMKLLTSIYRINTKWIFMINVPNFAILILFGKQILSILFGSIYAVGATALIFISIGYFMNYFLMNSSYMLMIYKRPKDILYNVLAGSLVNIILNFLLIPILGITGAAIATGSSFIIITLISFIQSYYITKINPLKNTNYFKLIAAILIPTVIILFIKNLIPQNTLTFIILSIGLVVLYLLMLILTKSFEEEDLLILKSMKNKANIIFLKRFIKK